jgi:hypothetical protein
MISTDTLATVGSSNYIADQMVNIRALNNGFWQWFTTDVVVVSASDGNAFYTFTDDTFSSLELYGGFGNVNPGTANDFAYYATSGSTISGINAAGARTLLGLGTMALQAASSVAITGGSASLSSLTAPYTYVNVVGPLNLVPGNSNTIFVFNASTTLSDALGLASYTNGFAFALKNVSGSTATFSPKAGETIDGNASLTLNDQEAALIIKTPTQWSSIAYNFGDVSASALTRVNDTNVTLTLGGTPATALLEAVSLTLGWTGQLGLTRGGTNASLTASNGGIVYSNASALAILAGTATAQQLLLSGASTTPQWSTTTYPLTNAINTIMYASSANVMDVIIPANSSVMISSVGGVPSWSTTLPSGLTIPDYAHSGANSDITSMTGLTGYLQAPLGIKDSSGNIIVVYDSQASAVNYLVFTSSSAGNAVPISTSGASAAVNLNLKPKGGIIQLSSTDGTVAQMRWYDTTGSLYTGFKAPTTPTNFTFVLPASDGSSGQFLKTDGSGNLSFASGNSGSVTSVATSGLATGGPITTTGTVTVTAAIQSDQETATSTLVAVVPGVQQYHPSAAKVWCNKAGSSTTINASYNVSSTTHASTGTHVINFTTAMSSANYVVVANSLISATLQFCIPQSLSTGNCSINTFNSGGALTDPTALLMVAYGDQ